MRPDCNAAPAPVKRPIDLQAVKAHLAALRYCSAKSARSSREGMHFQSASCLSSARIFNH
jgi:hypothetical protein